MKCLLCNANFLSEDELKNHYIWYHLINENDVYLSDLFKPDNIYKGCDICQIELENSRNKKKHMFLFWYGQMGGNRENGQLPMNILKRGPITYYTISYDQHKNFYDFFSEQIVSDFLSSVCNRFNPNGVHKIQRYAEILNQQQGEFLIAESTRVWLTNMYTAKYFDGYIKRSIKSDILRRIIINGKTSSSWYFKQFNRLTVITTSVIEAKKLFLVNIIFSVSKKMEFILDEAEDDTPMLQFSDEDEQEGDEEFSTFIDDKYIPEEGVSFYRERSSQNLSDYPKFHNETRDPIEATFSNTESYFGEDAQPEPFAPENIETVNNFNGIEKYSEKFLKSLLKFEDVDNHLFFSVIMVLCFIYEEMVDSKEN